MQPVLPAADQLWKQFLKLAQDVIEAADPKENYLSALGKENAFDRALKGLRLLSSHNCVHLSQGILAWIKSTSLEISQKYRSAENFLVVHGVCKRAAMWILAFEAGVQVLDTLQPQSLAHKDVAALCDRLLSEAVNWLLRADELVPRYAQYEQAATRQQVVERAAKVVGAMSRCSLPRVMAIFVDTLKEKLPQKKDSARDAAIALCAGARGVALSLDTDASTAQATAFLLQCNPLVHQGAKNKSQVQHAICGMLAAVLAPLVKEGPPASWQLLSPPVRAAWYSAVNQVREGLTRWANKNAKHIQDGYPLITALVCLGDSKSYAALVDSTADMLLRQMKLKEWRLVCLRCLAQLLGSYLGRYSSLMPRAEIHKWLDRCTRPVLASFRKGNFAAEHQEVMYAMCMACAEHYPVYALEELVVELLLPDPPECAQVGLRALHGIIMARPPAPSPRTSSGSIAGRLSGSKQPPAAKQVLEMMRRGQHPLDAPDVAPAVPKLHTALTRLLAHCHSQLGAYQLFSPAGEGVVPREKQALLPLLLGLLQVMPFLHPDLWMWPNAVPLKELPGYTAHVDSSVRGVALSAIEQMLRGCPHLRNTLLLQLAAFITTIPDDSQKALHEGLSLLRLLVSTWLEVVEEGAEPPRREALVLEVGWLEGILLPFLGHHDDTTRAEGLALLRLTRDLHRAITRTLAALAEQALQEGGGEEAAAALPAPAAGGSEGEARASQDAGGPSSATGAAEAAWAAGVVYLADVVEEEGDALAVRCYWDFWEWSDLWRDWKPAPPNTTFEGVLLAVDETAKLRRARLLGALQGCAAPLCPAAAAVAYAEANTRLVRLMAKEYNGRLVPPSEVAEPRKLEAWGCYAALATATPPACTDRVDKSSRYKAALPHRELLSKALLPVLSAGGSYVQQQAAVLALGNLHAGHLERLFEELPQLLDRFISASRQRGKVKPEEVALVRSSVANIYRIVADALPPVLLEGGTLKTVLLAWMLEAARHFSPSPPSSSSTPSTPSSDASSRQGAFTTIGAAAPFSEPFWDLVQVAYCLCSVARTVAPALVLELSQPASAFVGLKRWSSQSSPPPPSASAPAPAGVPLRKQLFELFAAWCDQGTAATGEGGYTAVLAGGLSAAAARVRDGDSGEALRLELSMKADHLDASARLAMAAMLQGPAFDTDARRSQGPVLGWLDRLLRGQASPAASLAPRLGPSRQWVARRALRALLHANLDLFPTACNRCYHEDPQVAKAYFRVLVEVYTARAVRCEQHILLSLILTKLVAPDQQVREDALHLLHVLEQREWSHGPEGPPSPPPPSSQDPGSPRRGLGGLEGGAQGGAGRGGPTVVLGLLQDSYQQFLYHLSKRLAREHPELSESLCEEMMTRQLDGSDQVTQHPVLTCLAPWMDNLHISAEWEGGWAGRLLKSCYLLTLRHGHQYPAELEGLWSTLAANKRNISPILHYLISFGMHSALQDLTTMLDYFDVAKRITLYLARVSPQHTVDVLVLEAAQQALEDGPPTSPRPPSSGPPTLFSTLLTASPDQDPTSFLHLSGQGGSALGSIGSLATRHSSWTAGEGGGSIKALKMPHAGSLRGLMPQQRSDSASSRSSTLMASLQAAAISGGGVGAGGGQATLDSLASNSLHISLRSTRVADSTQSMMSAGSVPEPASPALRPLLARPELALCLLAEVAYEQQGALRGHLALVLHLALLAGDHEEGQVAAHSLQLLLNLLYALAAQQQGEGAALPEGEEAARVDSGQAAAVIQHLHGARGRRLWAHEEASMGRPHLPSTAALERLTTLLLAALPFEPALPAEWAAQALRWALTARCRHLSSRSFQVYRALKPPLTVDAASSLLCCLQQCLASPAPHAMEVALEPLLTLQVLVVGTPPSLLPLYPHLFWAAIALLFTDSVPFFRHALRLFSTLLSRLPMHSPATLHTLLVAAPQAASATAIAHLTSTALLLSTPNSAPPSNPHPKDPLTNPFLPNPQPPPYSLPPSPALNPFLQPPPAPPPSSRPTDAATLAALEPWHLGQALLPTLQDPLSAPPPPHLFSIQHLLLKGLASPLTASPTLRSLSILTHHLTRLHPLHPPPGPAPPPPLPPPLLLRSREVALNARIAEALLGAQGPQLFISLAGALPYICAHLVAPAHHPPGSKEGEEMDEAVEELLGALGAGCREQGLPVLGQRVERLREVSREGGGGGGGGGWEQLEGHLSNIFLHLTRAFFPQYAPWLLCRCVDLLTAPAPEGLHRSVLAALKALFSVPDLLLGPATSLITSSTLLHPLVAMAQGGLNPAALEALDALLSFSASSKEVAAAQSAPSRVPPEVPMDVEACCCHSADIATAIQQILDTTGAASKLSRLKLLPHVPQAPGGGLQYDDEDD